MYARSWAADLRCKVGVKLSAMRPPHALSCRSLGSGNTARQRPEGASHAGHGATATAQPVKKRLRPLYATGFIHSFVLWYSIEKLFMRSVGLNDYLITIATLVYIVVMMTANIPLGILADRWSRKGVLHIATCALIGSSLVCGLSHGLAMYATGISVWGLFYAAYAGTYDSAIYDVVLEETGSAEAFERCYGRVQMFEATAFITSALFSALIARYSLRLEYFLTIPFTCCAFATLRRFREPGLHRTVPRVAPLSRLALETLAPSLRTWMSEVRPPPEVPLAPAARGGAAGVGRSRFPAAVLPRPCYSRSVL